VLDVFEKTLEILPKWGIDQIAFNFVIRSILKIKYSKAFKALDKIQYSNGRVLGQGLHISLGIKPMVAHANYAQGYVAKRDLLAQLNMWYL
jgi:hypothetical protein